MRSCLLLVLLALAITDVQCKGVDFSPMVDCSDAGSYFSIQKKCFDLYNIDVNLDASSFDNITDHPIETMTKLMNLQDLDMMTKLCKNIDNYVEAYMCSSKVSRVCLPDIPIISAIFPSRDYIRKTQEFICANYQNYNMTCVNDMLPDMADCANFSVASVPMDLQQNYSELMQNTLCISLQLASICAETYIKQCGELTLQIYRTTQPDVDSCSQTTDSPMPDQPTVHCTDPKSVRRGYLHCLSDNQILFLVPDQSSSDATSDFILQTMTVKESKNMCSRLPAYQKAINCTLSIQRQCSEDILKPTIPDPTSVQQGFEELCKGINDFDSTCVANNIGKACAIGRKKRSLAEQIILMHLCQDDKFSQQCLVSAISSCNSRTRSLYSTVLKSQSPVKCLPPKGGNSTPGVQVPVIG